MKSIRIAAAELNQTPLDWQNNFKNIASALASAREKDVDCVCLPEMSITGYGCEDAFLAPHVQEHATQILTDVVPLTQGMAVAVGLPVVVEDALFNGVAFVADGHLRGIVLKQFLAGDGVHYEPRWFKPWPKGLQKEIQIDSKPVQVGDIIFDINGIKIGFEICEDAWVADRPGIRLAKNNVDILLNPSASHFSFAKHMTRKSFVIEGSRAFAATYVYANLLGNEAGRIIYDGGSMIAQSGELLAESKRFSYKDHHLISADVDIEKTRMHRTRRAGEVSERNETQLVEIKGDFFEPREYCTPPSHPPIDRPMPKEEEFARAVSLGLWDYMRKSRSRGFVLSLSGGADSAAVGVLIRMMVEYALADLGPEGCRDELGYLQFETPLSADSAMSELLTCVYQSTRNSSDTTRNAAGAVARELGADFIHWDVDTLVEEYTDTVQRALGRKLRWTSDDLALQNIQARVRAPGVWMLANVKNALLVSTSNRSEAAVGYATMDGDTSGGLSPIAGIDKAYLLDWLKIVETDGLPVVGNIPVLNAITAQQPTAELRPGSAQTDETDLMPYNMLDKIEKLAIRDRKGPIQIYRQLISEGTFDTDTLKEWISRFFSLWSRNQWKRERYAPSFHLDDENLDPKTWCRFPILNGGFYKELQLMKQL